MSLSARTIFFSLTHYYYFIRSSCKTFLQMSTYLPYKCFSILFTIYKMDFYFCRTEIKIHCSSLLTVINPRVLVLFYTRTIENYLRMPPKKQYGLIKRNKKPETKLVASKLSFFDDGDSVWGFKNVSGPVKISIKLSR